MSTELIIGLVVGGILFALLFRYLHKKEEAKDEVRFAGDVKRRADNIKDRRKQPAGWTLWVEQGVNPSADLIVAIEAGIRYCIQKASFQPGYATHPRWAEATDLSRYNIALFGNVIKSPEGQVWCWKIPTPSNYKGSIYDINGSFLVAGQTIEENGEYGILLALPDHPDGFGACQCAVHETEHAVLFYVDPVKWSETATHSDGQGHPLIPDINKPVGLLSVESHPPRFACGNAVKGEKS